jgi:hypothetical protein
VDVIGSGRRSATRNALFITGFIRNFQSILGIEKPLLGVLGLPFETVPSVKPCTGTQIAQRLGHKKLNDTYDPFPGPHRNPEPYP